MATVANLNARRVVSWNTFVGIGTRIEKKGKHRAKESQTEKEEKKTYKLHTQTYDLLFMSGIKDDGLRMANISRARRRRKGGGKK